MKEEKRNKDILDFIQNGPTDKSPKKMNKKDVQRKIKDAAFWIIWPIICFYAAQYIVSYGLLWILGRDRLVSLQGDSVFTASLQAIMYAVIFCAVFIIPKKYFKKTITKEELGFKVSLPTWSDIGLGISGLVVAMILSGIFTAIVASFVGGFDMAEPQNLGFDNVIQPHQFIIAFLTLVVAAPVFEELIFRGVMYGQLRKISPWLAIVIVSVLFGAAHGQWNVGVTTFAMSLVMCFIREKFTDTIWAAIILHMFKNAIAFYLLFMAPSLIQNIMQ